MMISSINTLVQVVCQYFNSLYDVHGLKFSIETIDNPGWAISIPVVLSEREEMRKMLGTSLEYNGGDGEWINVQAHLKETCNERYGETGAHFSIADVDAVGSPNTLSMLCSKVISMIYPSTNCERLDRITDVPLLEDWLSRRADGEWEHFYGMSFEIVPNRLGISLVARAEIDVYSVLPEITEQQEVSVAMTIETSLLVKVKMEGDPRLVVNLLEQVIAFDLENPKP